MEHRASVGPTSPIADLLGRIDGWELLVWAGGLAATVSWLITAYGSVSPVSTVAVLGLLLTALAARRRVPALGLALALTAATSSALLGAGSIGTWTVLQLVLFSLTLHSARNPSAVAALITGAILAGLAFLIYEHAEIGLLTLGVIAWTAAAWGFASSIATQRRAVAASEARADELLLEREAEIRRRLTEDRLRIARDLHDDLAHNVAVITVSAGAAEASLETDTGASRAALRTIRDVSRAVLIELQQILGLLRGDGPESRTTLDVTEVVDAARMAGLHIELSGPMHVDSLPPFAQVTAIRILQEALTNAGRHGVGDVVVAVAQMDQGWRMTIRNNVAPEDGERDIHPPGYGLIGMRERAEAAGAVLRAGASDGVWTTELSFPYARGTGPQS